MFENKVIIDVLLFVVLYMTGKSTIRQGSNTASSRGYFMFFLLALFCVYAYCDGDYYHYKDHYEYLSTGSYLSLSIEPVYQWIGLHTFENYDYFRLVIWGGALMCMYIAVCLLDIDIKRYGFVFAMVSLTTFSYARVSLAMSLAFLGAILLAKKGGLLFKLISIVLLVGSFSFHKSISFIYLIYALAYFTYNRFNKRHLIILLIAYPFAIYITQRTLGYFMDYVPMGSDQMMVNVEIGQKYLNSDATHTRGIGALLGDLLSYSCFYLSAAVYGFVLFKKKENEMTPIVKFIAVSLFYIVYVASLFSFDLGFNTNVLYYRFLYYSCIPAPFVLVYYLEQADIQWQTWAKRILYIGATGSFYSILYSFYLQSLGKGI